jgi:NAD(P)H-hydrate epimerase
VKIFSIHQIKKWDQYTIEHEPISSIDLMERVAKACFNWISNQFTQFDDFIIFCGTGNNGGDGLAIARLLIENGYRATVYLIGKKKESEDFITNLDRLANISEEIYYLDSMDNFPEINKGIIIDALFGTGLNKTVTGLTSQLIHYINKNSQKSFFQTLKSKRKIGFYNRRSRSTLVSI